MSIPKTIAVAGIGEILWDLLPAGRQLGGAPTNFAYHTNAQGFSAVAVSSVGDDPLGREILTQVQQWGMTTEFLSVLPGYPTSTVTVALDEKGVRVRDSHWGRLGSPAVDGGAGHTCPHTSGGLLWDTGAALAGVACHDSALYRRDHA